MPLETGFDTHTHQAALRSSCAIPAPPNNTRAHANPNVGATFTSTATHNLTIPCACHEAFRVHTSNAPKVLLLPRNVTSVTPRNFTIPCACRENRASIPQTRDKVLRASTKCAPHHTFGMISTRTAISAETCHENRASTQRPETQTPTSKPHPTPQKHHSPNANPNVTAQKTAHLTKRCACAVKSSSMHTSTSYVSIRFHAISHESDTSRFPSETLSKSFPQWQWP